jgi:protein TonB
MFETAMLESTSRARAQRRWTTLLSISLQTLLVGALLAFPILMPEAIRIDAKSRILPPIVKAAGPELATQPPQGDGASDSTSPNHTTLQQPREIPPTVESGPGEIPEPPGASIPGHACRFNCGSGSPDGVIGGARNGLVPDVRAPEPEPTKRVTISNLDPGFLVHRVQPVYPPIAKQIRVQGAVVLRAIIGRDGTIQELRVVSGHPLLARAASDAVGQWRYRPYMLNGAAVEVDTQVTVNFYLSGR